MGWFGFTRKEKNIWQSIRPGNRVRISLPGTHEEVYHTKVSEVSEYYIYVHTPKIENAYMDLRPHTEVLVEVEIFHPFNGKINFHCNVAGQEWLKQPRIQLSKPRKIVCTQLRRCRRIPTDKLMEFVFVDEDKVGVGFSLGDAIHVAHIRNISESGTLLVLDKSISVETGAHINMKIKLDEESIVRARGKIVRIEAAEGTYGLGVDFVKMGERDLELLRKYILVTMGEHIGIISEERPVP